MDLDIAEDLCDLQPWEEINMSNQYVGDIDAALQRMLDARRSVVPTLGNDDESFKKLAAIQDSLVQLVKARDQEVSLLNGRSIAESLDPRTS